jgi:hypothetical protein
MGPELVVHADEVVARDHAHRDLIGELLGLQKRMVREHPDVSQLVSDHCIELLRTQAIEKSILDGEPEGCTSIDRRFHRDDERDLRLDRDVDAFRNPQLSSQTIDDELETLDDERRGFSGGGGCHRASEREEDQGTGRRQRDPRH